MMVGQVKLFDRQVLLGDSNWRAIEFFVALPADVKVVPGMEAEWQCLCEASNTAAGDTAANRATVVALDEDREEALQHLRRLSPSKVDKVILKDLKHSHLLSALPPPNNFPTACTVPLCRHDVLMTSGCMHSLHQPHYRCPALSERRS